MASRRSSKPIGFKMPAAEPDPAPAHRRALPLPGAGAVPQAERTLRQRPTLRSRQTAMSAAGLAGPAASRRGKESCPTCGRALDDAAHLCRARAGEDARPSPQGPHAPLPEAEMASSRVLRRAGVRPESTAPDAIDKPVAEERPLWPAPPRSASPAGKIEDIFLAMAPPLLHVFNGDVSRHSLSHYSDGLFHLLNICQI